MKVYTKSGDKGTTALIGGDRVSKNDIRVEAYGTVDELSAFVALLSDRLSARQVAAEANDELRKINSILMNIEAHLASGANPGFELPKVCSAQIEALEQSIDTMQSQLEAITKFTIPGGDELNSLCHVCRTICRRAERRAIAVAEHFELDAAVVQYLNRLSDYLYLLGRKLLADVGAEEILWRADK